MVVVCSNAGSKDRGRVEVLLLLTIGGRATRPGGGLADRASRGEGGEGAVGEGGGGWLQDVASCEGRLYPTKGVVLEGTAVRHCARQGRGLPSSGVELGHLLE